MHIKAARIYNNSKKSYLRIYYKEFCNLEEYKHCKVKVLLQQHKDIELKTILLNVRMHDAYNDLLTKDIESVCVIVRDNNINFASTQAWFGLGGSRSDFGTSTCPLKERSCSI